MEEPGLNPCCPFTMIEYNVIWSVSLLYISFLIIFEKEVRRDIGL